MRRADTWQPGLGGDVDSQPLQQKEFPIGSNFISMSSVVKQYDVGDGPRTGRSRTSRRRGTSNDENAALFQALADRGIDIENVSPFISENPSLVTIIRAGLGLPRPMITSELEARALTLGQTARASALGLAAALVARLDGRELGDGEVAVLDAAKAWLGRLLSEPTPAN